MESERILRRMLSHEFESTTSIAPASKALLILIMAVLGFGTQTPGERRGLSRLVSRLITAKHRYSFAVIPANIFAYFQVVVLAPYATIARAGHHGLAPSSRLLVRGAVTWISLPIGT